MIPFLRPLTLTTFMFIGTSAWADLSEHTLGRGMTNAIADLF